MTSPPPEPSAGDSGNAQRGGLLTHSCQCRCLAGRKRRRVDEGVPIYVDPENTCLRRIFSYQRGDMPPLTACRLATDSTMTLHVFRFL